MWSSPIATVVSGKKNAMRTALVSLIALVAAAPLALAQTPPAPPAMAAPTPTPTMPAAPAAATPVPPAASTLAAPAPAMTAPPPPAATVPGAPAAPAVTAPTMTAPAAAAPAPAPAEPAAPPPPPPAPTDPTAIALLSTLENVCVPSANGGNLAQVAKSAGYRKSGDNFVTKGPGYQLTVEANTYNRNQCHVNIVHPIDPESPAKPLVVALHNWAAVSRHWSLYRNDKNVQGSQEFTTRSWEHSGDGKDEALVLITMRKADGTPSKSGADTSTLLYSTAKTPGSP